MTDVTCHNCSGSGTDPISQLECEVCGGDGLVEAQGTNLLEALLNLIKATTDTMDTKIDALQDDMDIIKPWIDALYEDLNP